MYDRWSLREIWLQSVSSSTSRLRFAEQGPRSLPVCTLCSLLKPGSQLSRKSEWLHHTTGRASTVCRTFEMTHVVNYKTVINLQTTVQGYTLFDNKQMNNSKPTTFHIRYEENRKFMIYIYVFKSNKRIIKRKARYGPKKSEYIS
jgi:hypothetical protein